MRLAELDPVVLLDHPTTAALAPLAHATSEQRSQILAAAAELITAHTEPGRRDLLLGAAATLASIVLPRRRIATALKEATMPVPVRDTPLGRELYEEGRQDGRREGRQEGRREGRREGRQAVLDLTALVIRQRFGDDPRTDSIAARLAALPDAERLARITTATSLDDLDR